MSTSLTCGDELARSAVVPGAIAELMRHVAKNLDAHAGWVGIDTPEALSEHDALRALSRAYRGIATAASDAADLMRSLELLPPAPHDRTTWDRVSFLDWTTEKIELQRKLVQLLLEHIAISERALQVCT